MAAPLNNDSWIDPSKRAESILDYVLEDTSEEAAAIRRDESPITVELNKAPIVIRESDRSQSRVLFVTKDISVLETDSLKRMHFLNLKEMFNEIHIMVLSESWQTKRGVDRLDQNVWVYTTSAKHWWQQTFAAASVASQQLRFTDGFRPDIVVALDPFESGIAAMHIASKYDRAFQVHITEDLYDPEFLDRDPLNKWRLRMAKFVLKRSESVRASTQTIKENIEKRYTHIDDLALLPRHYDIRTIIQATEGAQKQRLYPQFAFLVLFVGKLDHESTLFRALDASRSILFAKSIGMVVLGDGPSKKEFQQRAEILGIASQVIFEKDESKLIPLLKSANILICTDTTEASDEVVIKAAASGLPLLLAKTKLREDLFTDGESAFLCNKEDTIGFSQKLVKFLNTNSLRTQFSQNARDTILSRLHEDPNAYKLAYRDTIEAVFMLPEFQPEEAKAVQDTVVEPGKEAVA